jgi:hypothetical protein
MNIKYYSLTIIVIISLLTGCDVFKPHKVDLKPNDKRPVYAVDIADIEEAKLLEQQLKIEVLRVEGNTLFFYQPDKNQMKRFSEIGYMIKEVDKNKVYYRTVKLKKSEKLDFVSLSKENQLFFINEEQDYYVVRANLLQIKEIIRKGYAIEPLSNEVRPRKISVIVKTKRDIQVVSETHIDIFNYQINKDSTYTIYGQAFDYQVDMIKNMGYTVRINP